MKMSKKWNKRIFALVLGTVVAGAPLFAAQAEESAFSRHDEHRYDVRRGMYEQDGGSDTEVAPGRYAREQRDGQQDDRQNDRRDEQRDGHRDEHRHGAHEEGRHEEHHEGHGRGHDTERHEEHHHNEQREHRYDVRRGRYEQEGGSDTEVRRGMYEQPSEDGSRRELAR